MVVFFTVCAHVTLLLFVGAQPFLTCRKPGVRLRTSSVFVLSNSTFKGSTLCRRKGMLGYGAVVIAPSKNPTQIFFLYDGAEHRERIPFENRLRDFSQHSAIEPVKVFL